jgi:hypothetical protein
LEQNYFIWQEKNKGKSKIGHRKNEAKGGVLKNESLMFQRGFPNHALTQGEIIRIENCNLDLNWKTTLTKLKLGINYHVQYVKVDVHLGLNCKIVNNGIQGHLLIHTRTS